MVGSQRHAKERVREEQSREHPTPRRSSLQNELTTAILRVIFWFPPQLTTIKK
mgnify:CR=1 FL=1